MTKDLRTKQWQKIRRMFPKSANWVDWWSVDEIDNLLGRNADGKSYEEWVSGVLESNAVEAHRRPIKEQSVLAHQYKVGFQDDALTCMQISNVERYTGVVADRFLIVQTIQKKPLKGTAKGDRYNKWESRPPDTIVTMSKPASQVPRKRALSNPTLQPPKPAAKRAPVYPKPAAPVAPEGTAQRDACGPQPAGPVPKPAPERAPKPAAVPPQTVALSVLPKPAPKPPVACSGDDSDATPHGVDQYLGRLTEDSHSSQNSEDLVREAEVHSIIAMHGRTKGSVSFGWVECREESVLQIRFLKRVGKNKDLFRLDEKHGTSAEAENIVAIQLAFACACEHTGSQLWQCNCSNIQISEDEQHCCQSAAQRSRK